jgi:hypothetical protein
MPCGPSADQRSSGAASNPLVRFGSAAGQVMPSIEYEWHDTDQHHQDGYPEPTEGGAEPSDHKETQPDHGDHELKREKHQSEDEDPTLLSAGQPGCDDSLVGVIDATAVLDHPADVRPCGVVKVILEGEPPVGIASLLNHVVHRAWQ